MSIIVQHVYRTSRVILRNTALGRREALGTRRCARGQRSVPCVKYNLACTPCRSCSQPDIRPRLPGYRAPIIGGLCGTMRLVFAWICLARPSWVDNRGSFVQKRSERARNLHAAEQPPEAQCPSPFDREEQVEVDETLFELFQDYIECGHVAFANGLDERRE